MGDVIDFTARQKTTRASRRLDELSQLSNALSENINEALNSVTVVDAIGVTCDLLGRLIVFHDPELETDILTKVLLMIEITALSEKKREKGLT